MYARMQVHTSMHTHTHACTHTHTHRQKIKKIVKYPLNVSNTYTMNSLVHAYKCTYSHEVI